MMKTLMKLTVTTWVNLPPEHGHSDVGRSAEVQSLPHTASSTERP